MSKRLAILGVGAVTAVGWTAAQTCAAARAALTGFRESGFLHHRPRVVPVIGASVPFAEHSSEDSFFERIVRLSVHALEECLRDGVIEPARTALILGVKEDYRSHSDFDACRADLIPAIAGRLGSTFHSTSEVIPAGHVAVTRSLVRARELLSAQTVDACLVGGADSYLNRTDLSLFEDSYWLKRPGVSHGFIPGEAAGWVSVTPAGRSARRQVRGEILGLGLAQEDAAATAVTEGYPTGRALQRALNEALRDAGIAEASVGCRVSDVNGEPYRTQDAILAAQRVYRTRRERLHTLMPAATMGEVGAATGALQIILALDAMRKEYAPGRIALCETSSDTGPRAGCVVGAQA